MLYICSTTSSGTQPLVHLAYIWQSDSDTLQIILIQVLNCFQQISNFLQFQMWLFNSTHHPHRSSLFYCWMTLRSPQSCQGAFCYFVRFDSQVRIYFLSDLWFHDLYLNQRRPSISLTLQNTKVWNITAQNSFIISKYADCKYEKW